MHFEGTLSRILRERGGSLPELVIVLAIIAILSAMAVPSYKAMIATAHARSVASEISGELRTARQLAMARRERLLIRFDQLQQTITFMRADSGDVLKVYQYSDRGVVIEEPTAGPNVFFYPSGRSATATTISIIDREGKKTILTVSLTGRVSTS